MLAFFFLKFPKDTLSLITWQSLQDCACVLSHVQLPATLWTVARQAPLSMEFSKQEHCSGLPSASPGDLPDPGVKLTSPVLAGGFFTTWGSGYNRQFSR